MPMDLGCPIIQASCADPYLILLSEDGQVVLLTLREGKGIARLHAQSVALLFVSKFKIAKKHVENYFINFQHSFLKNSDLK